MRHLDEELRAAELREAAAPLAIARILLGVRSAHRERILKGVKHLVAADMHVDGTLEQYAQNTYHHPDVKGEADAG